MLSTFSMAKHLLTSFRLKPTLSSQKIQPVFAYLNHARSYSTKLSEPKNIDVPHYDKQRLWTIEEADKVFKLVKEHGHKWDLIEEYIPGQSSLALCMQYNIASQNFDKLSQEDKNIIHKLCGNKEENDIDWTEVQKKLRHRKPLITLQYYHRTSKDEAEGFCVQSLFLPKEFGPRTKEEHLPFETAVENFLKRAHEINLKTPMLGPFTKEEDDLLLDTVKKYGTRSFERIKKEMKSERPIRSLVFRYFSSVNPEIDKSPWTEEEKERLHRLYDELKDVKLVRRKFNSKRGWGDINNRLRKYEEKWRK